MRYENLENILNKIGSEQIPDDIKEIARQTADNFSKRLARESQPRQHVLFELIFKNRLSKLAAAAVIIIGVLFVSYFNNISITAPAFSKIIDNVLSRKWIYMFSEDRMSGQIVSEFWYNPSQSMLYSKDQSGNAFVLNMNSGERHEYRDGQITITRMEDFDEYSRWISERMPIISDLMDRYEQDGAIITQKDSMYNSQPAWLYEVELTLPQGSIFNRSTQTSRYLWLVNKKTNLPILCESTTISARERDNEIERSVVGSYRYAFDYPDTGPADIYDLGVPADANIVDERLDPHSEISQLINKIDNIKETKYNSYAYIAREGDRLTKRVIKDGQNIREELLELKINGSEYTPNKEQYFQAMGQSFDSIDKWIDEAGIFRRQRIYIRDGRFGYETNDRNIDSSEPAEMSLHSGPAKERYNNSLIFYCWLYTPSGEIIKNTYSEENNLICTETQSMRFYFDPANEYMCVRIETSDGQVMHEIQEFGQTDSGMLYPSKISQGDRITYIYAQDVNDDLRARIDPELLPNLIDHRKLTIEVASQYAQQDSNDIEYTGFTPLHMAIYRQDIERVKTLLKQGADVEPEYDSGATPMEFAVASGNLEMVKLLHSHGADFISNDSEHRDALGLAVEEGFYEIADYMLNNGSDVDATYKTRPLNYAASNGDLEMVKMLLKHNPEIDFKDNQGQTPLYHAISFLGNKVAFPTPADENTIQRYQQVINTLIENGAQINIRDNRQRTPFLWTIEIISRDDRNSAQQIDFIRFLLEAGADPNLISENYAPLSSAVESKRYDIMQVLLEAKVDPWRQMTRSLIMQDYFNFLHYARIANDDKMYDILYPYMKNRYETTNKQLVDLTQKIVRACLNDDKETIDAMCIDHPEYTKPWPQWSQEIKQLYEGHEELFEQIIPGWFANDGLARTHIPLPDGTSNRCTTLGFIQLPDGQWKCFYYSDREWMPEFEQVARTTYAFETDLDRFWNLIYDNVDITNKFTTKDLDSAVSNDKYQGQVIISIQKENLKIDFEEARYGRKRQLVITPDFIKVYNGNTLAVYTEEYVQKQKDYPEQLIYHPSELIIDTSQTKYIFTESDGQVLLTQKGNTTKADRFVFDLDTWQLE